MAWQSSGDTNDEMIDNLKRYGIISCPVVEAGFRQVDRAYFVPRDQKHMAYKDQPLRGGRIHISAPHIYGTALEALELKSNSALSFLNVGSGTGYLSCIVSAIMGPQSSSVGVEIHRSVVDHAKESTEEWKKSCNNKVSHIDFLHGNALCIDATQGECVVGFDRIYIGASIESNDLSKITCLLRPGGILVGPVDDDLMKIVRVGPKTRDSNINSSMMDTEDSSAEFSEEVLSPVRFTGLLDGPEIGVVIPSKVWNPTVHHSYPDSFRNSAREILLCSNSSTEIIPKPVVKPVEPPPVPVNLAAMLPKVIWMEILSYTRRDWFEPPESEVDFLKRRLAEEQANTRRVRQARLEAEARLHMVEQERDVYRVLARRCQIRLEALLQQNHLSAIVDEDTGEAPLSGRERSVIFGLGNMLRTIQYNVGQEPSDSDDDDDDDDDEDDEDNEIEDGQEEEGLQRESSHMDVNQDLSESVDEASMSDGDEGRDFLSSGNDEMVLVSSGASKHPRTVSITSDDL